MRILVIKGFLAQPLIVMSFSLHAACKPFIVVWFNMNVLHPSTSASSFISGSPTCSSRSSMALAMSMDSRHWFFTRCTGSEAAEDAFSPSPSGNENRDCRAGLCGCGVRLSRSSGYTKEALRVSGGDLDLRRGAAAALRGGDGLRGFGAFRGGDGLRGFRTGDLRVGDRLLAARTGSCGPSPLCPSTLSKPVARPAQGGPLA